MLALSISLKPPEVNVPTVIETTLIEVADAAPSR
jgi:hypothetical protein